MGGILRMMISHFRYDLIECLVCTVRGSFVSLLVLVFAVGGMFVTVFCSCLCLGDCMNRKLWLSNVKIY